MHALLCAFGTRGDVQPMLALALALRARGHAVTFCGPPNFAAWVTGCGLEFVPVGMDFERAVERMELDIGEGLRLLRGEVGAQFRVVDAVSAGADVLVSCSAFVAGPSIAEKRAIPHAYVVCSPSLLPSRAHGPPVLSQQGLPAWVNGVGWWAYEAFMSAAFVPQVNRERHARGLAPIRRVWAHLFDGALALVASEPALAPLPDDAAANVLQTGAWFFDEPAALDDAVEAFLSAGPPPVYVGFGSMSDRRPAETSALLLEATRRAGVRAIVSSGWAKLGQGDLAAARDRILVVGATPHAKLFPRVAAVVHHGGAGTTVAAARAGVPQVLVPHMLDQFYWAAQVRRAGVGGDPIAKRALNAERLARALRAVLDDDARRARARALSALVRRDGVARAADALERLAVRTEPRVR